MIWTLRVTCVDGPFRDAECVRFIELDEYANLYDVHLAIQDAVHFDDECAFAFFLSSASPGGRRTFIPEGVDPEEGVDTDLYEDVPLKEGLPGGGKRRLFYLFDLEEEWIFEIRKNRGEKQPDPEEFYPLNRDDLGSGPDPFQYGNDFDDYVESEDAAAIRAARTRHPASGQEEEEDDEDDPLGIHSLFGQVGDDDQGLDDPLDDEDRW